MRISSKCSMALHVLVLLEVFAGDKATSEQIAKSVGCNPVMIRNLLGKLQKAGLIATQRGSGGSVLKKAPEEITIWAVYQAVDPNSLDDLIGLHPNPSTSCIVGKYIYSIMEKPYSRIKDSIKIAMEGITLQQLLDDFHGKIQV